MIYVRNAGTLIVKAVMINIINSIKNFDDVTKFRLIHAFLVAITMSILAPVLIQLKGVYMIPVMIGLFSISGTLAVKTNKYLVPLGNETLYRIGIFLHILLVINTGVYFINPILMMYLVSVLLFLIVANFGAYSISQTNYIVKYYPKDMPEFQIVKNNTWADGNIIGLIISTMCLFVSIDFTVIIFVIYNSLFILYMLWNWNFFRNHKHPINL